MKSLFDYRDYKEFVRDWVRAKPKAGRGQYKKMAEHMRVSSVFTSQVFKGDRELSLEQAYELTSFLGLVNLKQQYFLNLVQMQRAGTVSLKKNFEEILVKIKKEAADLNKTLTQDKKLSDKEKSIFYSAWYYTGIRMASSLKYPHSIEELSSRFDLERELVAKVLDFLIQAGLVKSDGKTLSIGPNRIHLDKKDPLIQPRQISWRLKGFEMMKKNNEDQIFYTGPMGVSSEIYQQLKDDLRTVLQDLSKKVVTRPPDRLACLNIDLFDF